MSKQQLVRRFAAPVVAACVAVMVVPGLALAKTPASVSIGPLKAAHGFKVSVYVTGCGSKAPSVEVYYYKGKSDDNLTYDYDGGGATCSASRSLGKATVTLNWPGLLTGSLKVARAGGKVVSKTPVGCKGGKGISRAVKLKGSFDLSIHAGALGTIKGRKLKGAVSRIGNLSCKPGKVAKGVSLSGEWPDGVFVDAEKPAHGASYVDVFATDNPGTGVTGFFSLTLTAKKKLFTVGKKNASATIKAFGPYAKGKLTWTSLPACPGTPDALNGSFGGSLTFADPVAGTTTLTGSQVSYAWIAKGNATPGTCNGSGSAPVTAAVDNLCDTAGYCSVSQGTNDDTFYDESDAGTQTITSESINFGDGSSASITPGGTVDHTYAAAGTYTATLTVTTSTGQTYTATTTAYIGS